MNKPITAMPKYAEYKDSSVDLFELLLPAHWQLKKCRYIFRFNKGLTITKENLQETGIPCVNYGEIHSKYGFEVDPSKHALKCVDSSYLKHSEGSLLKKGDFVFADTSEDIEGSGNFTYLNSNEPTFAGYHTLIAKVEVEESIRFLAYVLDSASFRKQVRKIVKGVKVYSVTQVILKNTVVWLPSLPEQTAIAKFLDDKVAKIDALVGIKRWQIELLAERKQILIQNAVTQGLNPDAPMKESGVDWIGEIPAHWEVKRLASFGRFSKGGGFSKSDLADEGTNAVLYGDIYTQYDFVINNAIRTISPKVADKAVWITQGDLLFTGSGETKEDIGKCVLYRGSTKAVAGGDVILFRQTENSPLFLSFCLNANGVVEQKAKLSKGEIIVHTYASKLKGIFIPIPSVVEQEEITEFIWKGIEKINTAITLKQNQIEKLTEYKTTLINAAVTGKIKVAGE